MAKQYDDFVKVIRNTWNSSAHIRTKAEFDNLRFKVPQQVENINEGKQKGTKDMKPRIFVSSTFYDLQYIREDLSNFIKAHDFDPIMFEDGDIGYTPGKPLINHVMIP